jgi:molybdenum cofactor biosynthesis enzyme MoaA
MNKRLEFYMDIEDFPNTNDFYNTLRSFLTDKDKMLMFYNLFKKKYPFLKETEEITIDNIIKKVSYGLSFQNDRVKITMSFN